MSDYRAVIAAISTPPAPGGLAVIRLSGEGCFELSDRLFRPAKSRERGGRLPSQMEGYSCQYGYVVCEGRTIDDVILTAFKAPESYTGEDTIEISCHGGLYLARRILRLALSLGASPAQPGEFTRRALLNGKLSLTQAEAVMDIIGADGEAALSSARLMHSGELAKRVGKIKDRIVSILSSLAAWCDYPDEDIPLLSRESLEKSVGEASGEISQILNDYDNGKMLRDGITTVIAGRPNVGKSTLMNALLGYERAIVTPSAGTTRDVIEETLALDGLKLRLTDTAGLRQTEDPAESIGIKMAKDRLTSAELVLAVIDGSSPLTQEDKDILAELKTRPAVVIVNKSDLPCEVDKEYFSGENILFVSAKAGEGLERLPDVIREQLSLPTVGARDGSVIYVNERQRNQLVEAQRQLGAALQALSQGETLDAVGICLDLAAEALLILSGERVTDSVVDEVFSRFCVGK